MIDDLLAEAGLKMDQAVGHVQAEFATVRTGRGQPGHPPPGDGRLLRRHHTSAAAASFSVPEPRLLLIAPYDKSSVSAIDKAIRSSDLGLNPSSDGSVLRVAFPPLTEERRRELIRLVRHMAEEGRVAVRNVRRHIKEDMEAFTGEISDDEIRRGEKTLQEVTDSHTHRIDELLGHKESELLEV